MTFPSRVGPSPLPRITSSCSPFWKPKKRCTIMAVEKHGAAFRNLEPVPSLASEPSSEPHRLNCRLSSADPLHVTGRSAYPLGAEGQPGPNGCGDVRPVSAQQASQLSFTPRIFSCEGCHRHRHRPCDGPPLRGVSGSLLRIVRKAPFLREFLFLACSCPLSLY